MIVVGAGPGGSSAAFYLARLGHRVLLLDRYAFPRDKSCGDALTRSAVRVLADMGVLPKLASASRTSGIRIFMRGKGDRIFRYPAELDEPNYGLVLPRSHLDQILCRHAVEAGATLWEETSVERLVYKSGIVVGVDVIRKGKRKRLHARVVIAADGANSRLASQAGLVGDSVPNGYAIRGYYTVPGLSDTLEVYAPLSDPTDGRLLPSYGWIFPLNSTTANIGIGIFEWKAGFNLRGLFEQFLQTLRREDPRFAFLECCSEWKGAPLRFDFAPERCGTRGLLLVGDAAGMISPFTGEGIGFALDSGRLAAHAIDQELSSGVEGVCLPEYASSLGQRYSGYFEAGRHSARRYLLIWHVLASTFHNDKPLFSLCRQAALLPEGIGDSLTESLPRVGPLSAAAMLHTDLLAVNEILVDALRRDWPFLARAMTPDGIAEDLRLRPALLVLLAAYSATPRLPRILATASALEMGCLALLSHVSVSEEASSPGLKPMEPNWGNMFAVMVGDYLMSRAYDISAHVAAGVSLEIANALARACEGWVREIRSAFDLTITDREYLDILARKAALLFELPCKLGAELAGASSSQVDAVCQYGRCLGMAFLLADEVLSLRGRASQLGKMFGPNLREGRYSLPILRAARDTTNRRLKIIVERGVQDNQDAESIMRLVQASSAPAEVLEMATRHAARAKRWLTTLPDGPARHSLAKLADVAVTRKHAET